MNEPFYDCRPDTEFYLGKLSVKVHSLSSGNVAATPILKSVPSQFSPFIL